MTQYRWRALRFDAPEGRDDSTILLVDKADPPAWNLTVRVDELPGGAAAFGAYVDGQESPPGATLEGKTPVTVAGGPGFVFVRVMAQSSAGVLRQRQAFVLVGGDVVVVVTMTARAAADATARAAFDRVLATLSPEA